MNKFTAFIQKWGGVLIAPIALVLAVQTANSACCIWFHQPAMPSGMDKLKKQR